MRDMGLMSALHLKLALLICMAVAAQTKPGCNNKCGNMSIPYPFGTSENCYIDQRFSLKCTITTSPSGEDTTHQLIYSKNITVLNISLDPTELTVSVDVTKHCYYSKGYKSFNMSFIKFSISNTKNRFTVVGCNTYAYIRDLTGSEFTTGCMLSCSDKMRFENGSCLGVGCCQTSFPKAIGDYNIILGSLNNTEVLYFNPCSYAFVAKNGSFDFSSQDLLDLSNRTQFPVVLDWAVGDQTCAEAQRNESSYACKNNTRCLDSSSVTGIGYQCFCEHGFKGNPYLSHPHSGCKDINECEEENRCSMRCHNVPGNYTCSCPWGYEGDGYKDGSGCKFPIMKISLGITITLLVVFTLISTLCWVHKQRALKQLRRKHFEQNGGDMLRQLYQQQGHTDRTKIFGEDELRIATNNFHESKIIGRGGQGTVYKGILPDNTPIAIKKSRVGDDPRQIKVFINEVAVLS